MKSKIPVFDSMVLAEGLVSQKMFMHLPGVLASQEAYLSAVRGYSSQLWEEKRKADVVGELVVTQEQSDLGFGGR